MIVDIKIQSISDIITNSSTEVYTVYHLSDKDSIKNVVNAILAINSNYTFDDFFTIKIYINEDALVYMYEHVEEIEEKYNTEDDFISYVHTLSDSELLNLEDKFDDLYSHYNFFDGYVVSIRPDIEATETLQKARDVLNSLDTIFDVTYSENW
jgi:hypothetical protein